MRSPGFNIFDIRCSPFRNLRFDWRMIKIQSLNFNAFIYGRKGMEMEAGFRCCGWCCSALLYLDWTHIKHNLGVQGCSGYRMSITWSLKSIIHLYKTTLQRDDFPRCSTGSHPISNKGIKRITCALFLDGKRDSHFEGLPPSRTSGYARPPWKSSLLSSRRNLSANLNLHFVVYSEFSKNFAVVR